MRGDNITLVVLLCSCIILLGASSSSVAILQELRWEVEYMKWAPDCVDSIVMGINGEFPGPTIRAKAGDTLHIHVTNKLHTEGIVIHWHGIRQLGSPWADGTAGISQCPIDPGETFTYIFKVDKAGTYFYHGHYGMQRSAGLYGSVIVDVGDGEKEPFEQYHSELSLLLSDWWHLASRDQQVRLSSKPLHWIGEPQALLLNGKGQYNCSLAASKTFLDWIKEFFGGPKSLEKCNFKLHEKCANPVLTVEPNKVYRLRIASTTALASLNLQIENHKMKVVEADGNYVEPFEVNDLDIYSGESYSVLVKTDQSPKKNYWISVGVRGRKPNTQPGLTILNYKPNQPTKLPTTKPPITPAWNDYNHSKSLTNKLLAANVTNYIPPPKASSRRIILLNTQGAIDGYTKWAINNVSLTLPTTPYLAAVKSGLKELAFDQQKPDEDFSKDYDIYNPPQNQNAKTSSALYEIGDGEVVDVILQNAHMLNKSDSEVHPWHLHGHDFWVLGHGEGRFEAERDEKKFNLVNPPLKNTVVLYPHGWTALRFVGDNPGVWAFHCHIEPHLHLGMGVVFGEALEKIREIHVPEQAMACGLTATTAIKSTEINKPNQP